MGLREGCIQRLQHPPAVIEYHLQHLVLGLVQQLQDDLQDGQPARTLEQVAGQAPLLVGIQVEGLVAVQVIPGLRQPDRGDPVRSQMPLPQREARETRHDLRGPAVAEHLIGQPELVLGQLTHGQPGQPPVNKVRGEPVRGNARRLLPGRSALLPVTTEARVKNSVHRGAHGMVPRNPERQHARQPGVEQLVQLAVVSSSHHELDPERGRAPGHLLDKDY